VDQAAAYIASSKQRIYDLRSSGRLTRHGDGRRALISRAELDQLISGGQR
jgi:excisionase family DNA binding protein